jgi:thymidylate synthase
MHVVAKSLNEAYNKLAFLLRDDSEYLSSPRGMKIKESLGVSFKITDPRQRWVYNPARKFKHRYAIAETVWYLLGDDSTQWISYYAPFWEGISDDGLTANSAYGARIFKPHGRIAGNRFVQWEWVKAELKRDPDTRRAIIHIKSPIDSIDASKDVPCTLALQFMIRDNRLHMVVNMRSSDFILGIANDVPAFTFFQELMALELGLELGDYIHVSNSLHVYERHWDMLEEMCLLSNLDKSVHEERQHSKPVAMPSLPPLDKIKSFESKIRSINNLNELEKLVSSSLDLSDYWDDWIRVLASHRAWLLGDKTLSSKFFEDSHFG